ncbi:SMI1/KNR4 family protein [Nonomuraea sp. NPDC001831]|uniref:SMI1/KNR4 family protein n=1 Tax=Nonomuraea sp. NPDC001831 TaxID=3364340 RepID=UPI0036AC628F
MARVAPRLATPDDVMRARAETAMSLPAPLVALWRVRDGLHTESGVVVYSAGDIGERNATHEVARYAPGFLLVGDDSGGCGFLLRADDPDSAVFSSDLGDLDPAGFDVVAADFASWIESLETAVSESL